MSSNMGPEAKASTASVKTLGQGSANFNVKRAILTLKTGFMVQGHIFYSFCTVINAVNYQCIIHIYYLEKT